jgi:hypothetical protein
MNTGPDTVDLSSSTLLLTISLYSSRRPIIKLQSFLVPAHQPIWALRDSLRCRMDHVDDAARGMCANACFFIEETFYHDTRHDDSIRLSEYVPSPPSGHI